MKTTTKITAGYGLLLVVLMTALVYQVSLINRIEAINRNLTDVTFQLAFRSIELWRDLEEIDEFTRKWFATRDPGYGNRLRDLVAGFDKDLQAMRSLDLSSQEQKVIGQLSEMWTRYSQGLPSHLAVGSSPLPADEGQLLRLLDPLDQMRASTWSLLQFSQQAIRSQVSESARIAQQAERLSWITAPTALLLSLVISLLIVRSIRGPLRRLTEGTQAIAAGKFYYLLDAHGDDEFAQLAGDFNTMIKRLEELDGMKRDFVSHASHELKAPLASMQETTQLLLEEIPGPITEKQKRLLQLNLQSGRRLSSMISNLLDLSRMETGVMDYELRALDLVALVRNALAEALLSAREKQLRLEADLPSQALIVNCDGTRILQVVSNVLGNAIKFSPTGGLLKARVELVSDLPSAIPKSWQTKVTQPPPGKGLAVISIADAGSGVPDSHKERIFEKFHQVKQGNRVTVQGAGLGLAICRTIMEAHNGAIWVEDQPGGGSTFLIMLPESEDSNQVVRRRSSPI